MNKRIPELIRRKRLTLNETQTDFGKRFNVTGAAVCMWENGTNGAPYSVIEFVWSVAVCPYCGQGA